ncbi:MAG: class I SAM-dependent methyltransferase [Candidatus Omnitrophica bacterium]|nr:class I SAM-dependent methyltransferase [Candidatus Omnitrophota bacterium]
MGLSGSGSSENSSDKAWDSFWQERGEPVYSWAKRRMIKILGQYAGPGMHVLDAGCGSGFFSSYFITKGCDVYSMDYSDRALSIAMRVTKNKAKAYIKADILKKALDIKFDIIFTDGLLEHYSPEEQDIIVLNMKAMKKDRGFLINFAPNRRSLWSAVRPFCMNIRERPFTFEDFIRLHLGHGLDVVSSGGINVLPFRISPEKTLGRFFGMLFYCVSI